jgi:hypothetical protein
MWSWFNCYLSGRHEFGMWCEPGTIFLRCVHCGSRSAGWALHAKGVPAPVHAHTQGTPAKAQLHAAMGAPRVAPFNRTVAS